MTTSCCRHAFSFRPTFTTLTAFTVLTLLATLSRPCRATADVLLLQPPSSDRSDNLKFGQSVCVTRDGRTVAIGANGHANFRGAIYLHTLTSGTGHRPTDWTVTKLSPNATHPAEERAPHHFRLLARGSGLGFSCALSSTILVAGAPGHDTQRGALFLFVRQHLRTVLTVPHARSGDMLGWAVAIGAGGKVIAASAKGRRAHDGHVFIFRCTDELLTENVTSESPGDDEMEKGSDEEGDGESQRKRRCRIVASIPPPDYTDAAGPRGIRIRNNFGCSLALDDAGTVLVVGSTGFQQERGAAYVFRLTRSGQSRGNERADKARTEDGEGEGKDEGDESWDLVQRLESPNAQDYGFFGFKVGMDASGSRIVVGADGEGEYRGAAYLFDRKESMPKTAYEHVPTLKIQGVDVEDNVGGSVALSGDGRAVVVGAPGVKHGTLRDHGVMRIYERLKKREGGNEWNVSESVWLPKQAATAGALFAWTVSMSGDGGRFAATAPDANGGSGVVVVGSFQVTGKPKAEQRSLQHDDVVDEDLDGVRDEL